MKKSNQKIQCSHRHTCQIYVSVVDYASKMLFGPTGTYSNYLYDGAEVYTVPKEFSLKIGNFARDFIAALGVEACANGCDVCLLRMINKAYFSAGVEYDLENEFLDSAYRIMYALMTFMQRVRDAVTIYTTYDVVSGMSIGAGPAIIEQCLTLFAMTDNESVVIECCDKIDWRGFVVVPLVYTIGDGEAYDRDFYYHFYTNALVLGNDCMRVSHEQFHGAVELNGAWIRTHLQSSTVSADSITPCKLEVEGLGCVYGHHTKSDWVLKYAIGQVLVVNGKSLDLRNNMTTTAYGKRKFDTIVINCMLPSVRSFGRYLTMMHKRLRPGGKMIVVERALGGVDHRFRAEISDMVASIQNGIPAGVHLSRLHNWAEPSSYLTAVKEASDDVIILTLIGHSNLGVIAFMYTPRDDIQESGIEYLPCVVHGSWLKLIATMDFSYFSHLTGELCMLLRAMFMRTQDAQEMYKLLKTLTTGGRMAVDNESHDEKMSAAYKHMQSLLLNTSRENANKS